MRLFVFAIFSLLFTTACSTVDKERYTNHASMSGPVGQIVQEVSSYGLVTKVDSQQGRIEIKHAPIPSLNWAPMLMTFSVAEGLTLENIQQNDIVDFVLELDKNQNHRIKNIAKR